MAKKKRPIPAFLHRPIYWAIRSVITAVGAAPLPEALRVARGVGRLFGRAPFNRKRLERAIENIAVARPGWTREMRLELALRAYEHVFMLGVEMASTERLLNHDGWPPRVETGHMGPTLRELLRGAPCVTITGHCGNWELLGYSLAQLGFPLHALYRPLDLRPLDEWVRRTREAHGLKLVDKFGGGDDVLALMRSGGIPGFVADQNAGVKGVFVPFFGRLASTYKSIALAAVGFNATVFCGMARRSGIVYPTWDAQGRPMDPPPDFRSTPHPGTPLGLRYRLEVVDMIRPEEWSVQPDPVFYISARYRRAIERMVEMAPEQFFWMHRYWKSRPRHEMFNRPFPAALRRKLEALPWMTQTEMDTILEHSRRDTAECQAGLAGGRGPRSAESDEAEDLADVRSVEGLALQEVPCRPARCST